MEGNSENVTACCVCAAGCKRGKTGMEEDGKDGLSGGQKQLFRQAREISNELVRMLAWLNGKFFNRETAEDMPEGLEDGIFEFKGKFCKLEETAFDLRNCRRLAEEREREARAEEDKLKEQAALEKAKSIHAAGLSLDGLVIGGRGFKVSDGAVVLDDYDIPF